MAWNPRVHTNEERPRRDPLAGLKRLLRLRVPGPTGPWRGKAGAAAIALVALVAAATSYYQIEPDEVGVIRRLGRFVGTSDPGPHFRLPFGIERVQKVPVQRQLKMEFGFRTGLPGAEAGAAGAEPKRESLMLTGDLNVAVVEWIVQYKIEDPYAFLFKVRNVEETLRSLSEAAVRSVVGDHSVNEVLTTGRQRIATQAKEVLQQLADRYDAGVDVQQLVLQDVNPPDPVKPSFNEVNQAIQEKERAINEAQAELNKAIPRARGEAEQAIRAAEGYAIERVNRARGEAERFSALQVEYRRSPDVTRRRLHLETLAEVLPRAGRKVILDHAAKGMTPILPMERRELGSATATAAVSEASR
ncbi:MAG TPA: FtsH protease activity modulator HflK [Anaeromyxobacter sp.]|nr:FtsH protease activity modulator HflK [Anaeromyxobacter sp.]